MGRFGDSAEDLKDPAGHVTQRSVRSLELSLFAQSYTSMYRYNYLYICLCLLIHLYLYIYVNTFEPTGALSPAEATDGVARRAETSIAHDLNANSPQRHISVSHR